MGHSVGIYRSLYKKLLRLSSLLRIQQAVCAREPRSKGNSFVPHLSITGCREDTWCHKNTRRHEDTWRHEDRWRHEDTWRHQDIWRQEDRCQNVASLVHVPSTSHVASPDVASARPNAASESGVICPIRHHRPGKERMSQEQVPLATCQRAPVVTGRGVKSWRQKLTARHGPTCRPQHGIMNMSSGDVDRRGVRDVASVRGVRGPRVQARVFKMCHQASATCIPIDDRLVMWYITKKCYTNNIIYSIL